MITVAAAIEALTLVACGLVVLSNGVSDGPNPQAIPVLPVFLAGTCAAGVFVLGRFLG